ncbi:hypothetical protein LTR27_001002 [Elasticomyces elasticus]|nr:hypothetical protein LTR27_001002 [Elasticomyces elasticus]
MPFLDKIETIAKMNMMCYSAESVSSVARRTTEFIGKARRPEEKVSVLETKLNIGADLSDSDVETVRKALDGMDCKGGVTVNRSELDGAEVLEAMSAQMGDDEYSDSDWEPYTWAGQVVVGPMSEEGGKADGGEGDRGENDDSDLDQYTIG